MGKSIITPKPITHNPQPIIHNPWAMGWVGGYREAFTINPPRYTAASRRVERDCICMHYDHVVMVCMLEKHALGEAVQTAFSTNPGNCIPSMLFQGLGSQNVKNPRAHCHSGSCRPPGQGDSLGPRKSSFFRPLFWIVFLRFLVILGPKMRSKWSKICSK